MRGNAPERLVSGSDDFTMFLWEPFENKHPKTRMTGHQQVQLLFPLFFLTVLKYANENKPKLSFIGILCLSSLWGPNSLGHWRLSCPTTCLFQIININFADACLLLFVAVSMLVGIGLTYRYNYKFYQVIILFICTFHLLGLMI